MNVDLDVAPYSSLGITIRWRPGHSIQVTPGADGLVHLRLNRQGLLTLAQHLVTLALPDVPSGSRIHYDADAELEAGSSDLLIELADA